MAGEDNGVAAQVAGEKRKQEADAEQVGEEESKRAKVAGEGEGEAGSAEKDLAEVEKDAEGEQQTEGGAQDAEEKGAVEGEEEPAEGGEAEGGEDAAAAVEKKGPVQLGPKTFETGMDMYRFFADLLSGWSSFRSVNEYEHLVLLDLLQKGHPNADSKIGKDFHSFQVRPHPEYKNRCFFIVRSDKSAEDFSFRKCVEALIDLPDEYKLSAPKEGNSKRSFDVHRRGGRGGQHGGRGRGRGGWRGGRGKKW